MIDFANNELALSLQQPIRVSELGVDGCPNIKIESTMAVVYPGTDVNAQFGQNLVLEDKGWTVIPMNPFEDIEEGDQIELLNTGEKMTVRRVPFVKSEEVGDLKWALCEQLQ